MWALHPEVLVKSFSNSGHISLVPRSRRQWILGAKQFLLWPLGIQMPFSCLHSRDQSFQLIFFIFTPNMLDQGPIDFQHSADYLWPPGGEMCLFLVCNVKFSIDLFQFLRQRHTFLKHKGLDANQFSVLCSSIFGHQGARFIFLACVQYPLVCSQQ